MSHFPYNLFLTSNNLSLEQSNKNESKESILEAYRVEIDRYLKENRISLFEMEKNHVLNRLNTIFLTMFRNSEFLEFSKELVFLKYNLLDNISRIESYSTFSKDIKPSSFLSYQPNYSFLNPFDMYSDVYQNQSQNKSQNESQNRNQTKNNIGLNSSNITSQTPSTFPYFNLYNTVNPTLPTLGDVISISEFVKCIVMMKESLIVPSIPIRKTNIAKYIVHLLFHGKADIRNEISISSSELDISNNKIKRIIESKINNIQFSLEDCMMQVKSEKENTRDRVSKRVDSQYLIPFQYSSPTQSFVPFKTKTDIDMKTKSVSDVLKHNTNLLSIIIKNVYTEHNKKYLYETNVMTVLSCFVFVIIQMISIIYKQYIYEIQKIIENISTSKEFTLLELNINDVFNYIGEIEKSVYKYKLVLLNNFYELFLPSSIDKSEYSNYGMKKNDFGCYEPEVSFNVDNLVLYDMYPFQDLLHYQKSLYFLSSVKNKYDIYDQKVYGENKKEVLEIGGFLHSIPLTIQELENYNIILQNKKIKYKFYIFLLDYLEKSFKSKIPLESFSDIKDIHTLLMKNNLKFSEKSTLYDFLYEKYTFNIKQSIFHLNRLMQLHKESKSLKSKEILSISSNLYYLKSEGIISICKKYVKDNSTLNKLISSFEIVKIKYEELLKYQKEKIEKEINIQHSKSISFNDMKNAKVINKTYWKDFQKKIKFSLYIPFEYENSIQFLSIFSLLFDNTFSYEDIDSFRQKGKKLLCTYQIKNIKFRILKNKSVKNLHDMKSISILRFFIYRLMTNKEFYEENTKVYSLSKKHMDELSPQFVSLIQISKLFYQENIPTN